MSEARKTVCRVCGGTGQTIHAKSWFPADGYYRVRCGICRGTGVSAYKGSPAFVREQAALRAKAA